MRENIQSVITQKKSINGYILLETILTFSLLLVMISCIPLLVSAVPKGNDVNLQRMEASLFFQQLALEIRESNTVSVEDNKLLLYKINGEHITFEKFQDRVRRRKDGAGNEWVLQNVKEIEFQRVNHGVFVTIVDQNGQVYEKRISKVYSIEG